MDKNKQAGIFNMFHDGGIIDITQENNIINLTIEIPYLAELINSRFTKFYCTLTNCSTFIFEEWGEGNVAVSDLVEIINFDLSIIQSRVEGDFILIFCEIDFRRGGALKINFDEISIFDENKQQLTYQDLSCLCSSYWN